VLRSRTGSTRYDGGPHPPDLGASVPCKPIEAESRSRVARKSGIAIAGRGGSFFRSPRAPRAPRPGARPPPKDGTDPAPASSHHPSSLSPQFDYPGFSFPPVSLSACDFACVTRGCEMGCAGDARQASVPAATSDRHTQHRLTRHTRGAPRASRRRRRASEPGPLTPSVPREPAVTVDPFPSARADRANIGPLSALAARAVTRAASPRIHESPAAHSGGHPAARRRTPPYHRESGVRVGPSAPNGAHCGVSILLQLHPSHSRTIYEERGCRPADTAGSVRPTAAPVIWRQGHVSSAPRRRRIRSLPVTCLRALALRVQHG
jgi:hypothetical protein